MMHARWVKQVGFAGALTLTALVIDAPAQAQDDAAEPNAIQNLEQKVWGGIVRGLGLRDPYAPQIDYRERSPLVVPPTRDLPPPQARAKPRDPNWPNDPDLARAEKAREAKKTTRSNAQTARESSGRALTPSELEPTGSAGRGPATASSNRSNAPASGAEGAPVAPSELGYFGGLFSGRAWGFGSGFGGYQDETGTFTAEPPRARLTEPPPGYQTPSADQPYGVTRRVERSKSEQFDPAGRDVGGVGR